MRLLDRYLLRELLGPLGFCLGGFLLFWISFDLFSTLGKLQESGLNAAEMGEYYALKMPELLVLVMPIALLLALLYTLTQLSRHHELIAIQNAGQSLWRTSVPYLAVGLLFTGIVAWLNEKFVPESLDQTQALLTRHADAKAGPSSDWKTNLHFRNAKDGRIWIVSAYNARTFEMKDPHVEWRLPGGAVRLIIAKTASRTNGVWTFYEVEELIRSGQPANPFPETRKTGALAMPEFSETPRDIEVQIKFNRMSTLDAAKKPALSLAEIGYLKEHLQLNVRDTALLDTLFHYRLATPWTCLVVVLISLPFGAPSGRRNVYVGVASSIFICFVFFVLLRLGLALGTSGKAPAWAAAWAPNLIFSLTGIWMTQRVK